MADVVCDGVPAAAFTRPSFKPKLGVFMSAGLFCQSDRFTSMQDVATTQNA